MTDDENVENEDESVILEIFEIFAWRLFEEPLETFTCGYFRIMGT